MGQKIELNTMLRLQKSEEPAEGFVVGNKYLSVKNNVRLYPTDLAILLLQEDWNAVGYCAIRKVILEGSNMELSFEILSLFTNEEKEVITRTMLEGLKQGGYTV